MTTFDPKLYDKVLSQPEGMPHREYRKVLARYVTAMTEEARTSIVARREEIEAAEDEWKELNFEVLTRLGFREGEAAQLMDKRLDSPGMRILVGNRADEIKKHLRARDILRRVR